MERKFYTDDFEELIRRKTDQYKMYPSDTVWKGIYSSLHTKRRRFIAGMSVLITGILLIAGKELLTPAKHISENKKPAVANLQKTTGTDAVVNFQAFQKENFLQSSSSSGTENKTSLRQFIPFDLGTDQQDNAAPSPSADYIQLPVDNSKTGLAEINEITSPDISKHAEGINSIEKLTATINPDINEPLPKPDDINAARIQKERASSYDNADKKQSSWLQDYAVVQLTPVRKHNLEWQLYVSPTVNYRQLSGVDYSHIKSTIQNVPIALTHFGNVDDYVDHTPAVGYEVGGSILYRMTRNLTLKAGLEFNYSRYIIKAYSSMPELATITLNSYYGYIPDSLTAYTNVRNLSGKSKENLQNRYYQISAPIGLEMRIIGNGKLQFHIGGTIQPTYLLNINSYLLTTDFVNYTKEPSLFRRWNVTGGLEAFLSYQLGGYRLQLGPQFRYQFLSTYTNQYPFRENLMGYGIKIGISKAIR